MAVINAEHLNKSFKAKEKEKGFIGSMKAIIKPKYKEQLWMHLTAYDNFKFFGAIYDISEKETEKRIQELSKLFNLEKFINTPVRNLSLGQRIRCEIVASLIHRPKVLFLDEPTIGLDPVVK